MANVIDLKATGLNISDNQLSLPEGSMIEANNINIRRNDVIEPRRGFKSYGTEMDTENTAKQLMQYRGRILRHYDSSLEYQDGTINDGTVNFTRFSGDYNEPLPGIRIKSSSFSGNFFFTTDEGVKKISAKTAEDFTDASGYINQAGGVKALDVDVDLVTSPGFQSGFLPEDSKVSYRVVWGKKDANDLLVLGSPSNRVEAVNALDPLTVKDFNILVNRINNFFGVALTPFVAQAPTSSYFVDNFTLADGASTSEIADTLISFGEALDDTTVYARNVASISSSIPLITDNVSISSGVATITFNPTLSLAKPAEIWEVGDKIAFNGTIQIGTAVDKLITGIQTITAISTDDKYYNFNTNTDINSGTETITISSHGFVDGDRVAFTATTGGFTLYTLYYVVGATTNTFQVSTSLGGTPLNLTAVAGTNNVCEAGTISFATNFDDKAFAFDTTANIDGATETITITNHGFANGDNVKFSATTGGFTVGTIYYVTNVTTNTFKVSTTPNGTALNLTAAVGTNTVSSAVLIDSTTQIKSGAFKNILATGSADYGTPLNDLIITTPSTTDQSRTIQDTLGRILAEIQALPTSIIYTNDSDTSGDTFVISSAAIVGANLEINFSSGDPSLRWAFNNLATITGFTPATSGVLNGTWPVVAVTSTKLTLWNLGVGVGAVTVSPTRTLAKALVINPTYYSDFLSDLALTTTANVQLEFSIPDTIDSSYFYQIYRGNIATATGAINIDDISSDDELKLVIEQYPTAAELAAHSITVLDDIPDSFRGANLYTNSSTGEGILQANDPPPFCIDMNQYKNTMFFANTKTLNNKLLTLIGVENILTDIDASVNTGFVITNGTDTNRYKFVRGVRQVQHVLCSDYTNLRNKYFLLNSANDVNKYYVWFSEKNRDNTDPAIADRVGIQVRFNTFDAATQIASKLYAALLPYNEDFVVAVNTSLPTHVDITNTEVGPAANIDFTGMSGWAGSATVEVEGSGESILPEITSVTTVAGNLYTSAGTADYFTINSGQDRVPYYVWFHRGTATEPVLTGRTGILITLTGAETAAQVATFVSNALTNTGYFTTSVLSNVVTVTTTENGATTNATEVVANAGFLVSVSQEGALNVVASDNVSPAAAVDETAKSMVRVINQNLPGLEYAYYLSSTDTLPGKIYIQSRQLTADPFYIEANTTNTGDSFNPSISPVKVVSASGAISSGSNPTTLTVAGGHGLVNGDSIVISGSNSLPSIDGIWPITYVSSTAVTIATTVASVPNPAKFTFSKTTDTELSENDERPNRVYYSKNQQPEAVPLVNFVDVGARDKAILRIYPIRDSLLVFKEDGLYRISGELAPWTVSLFDITCILSADDSLGVVSNVVYGWTTAGITAITESSVQVASRKIDTQLLKLNSDNYPNFRYATWGTGYQSDNSYIVYTVDSTIDEVATIAYRYCDLTDTWTTYDRTNTCGIVNETDGKMYMGAGDIPFLEQERKSFDRTDYADRQYSKTLNNHAYIGNDINFNLMTNFEVGDVLTQEQTLTIQTYNQLLLKLDLDPGTFGGYFDALEASNGENMRDKLEDLALRLDSDMGITDTDYVASIAAHSGTITNISVADPTVITSASHGLANGRFIHILNTDSVPVIDGYYSVTVLDANTFTVDIAVTTTGTTGTWSTVLESFEDIQNCYNIISNKLNNDATVAFTNYTYLSGTTLIEAIITEISIPAKTVTISYPAQFTVGPLTLYKAFETSFTYGPITFGDVSQWKQVRESTIMLDRRNITDATIKYATDLLPSFNETNIPLDGNGNFGSASFFGNGFFGGESNAAPIRTIVPRNNQRCRYMLHGFNHKVAREKPVVYGMTLTFEPANSTRAYR